MFLYAQWLYKSQDNIVPYAKTVLQQANRIGELNLMAQINLNNIISYFVLQVQFANKVNIWNILL